MATPLSRASVFLLLVGLIFYTSSKSEGVTGSSSYQQWESLARDHAYVTSLSVSAPQGRLVLVRNAGAVCAIRFTAFHRGGDEKSPTTFNSGEETLFATAEEIRLTEFESKFRILQRETVNLVRGPIVGFGRLGFQKGRVGLRCGNAKLEWTYPNNIGLGSYAETAAKRVQVELAPTAWSDVSQIDLSDERLHWHRYDDSRKDILIPVEDLPNATL
jgi:hypothetical protein